MVSKITWISAGTKTPFLARKTFTVDKKVRKAVAKVCGLGQFVFYVNGKRSQTMSSTPAGRITASGSNT